MAMKRVVSKKAADERNYEKLSRDLEVLPAGHADRARKQAELNTAKARMAAKRP